MDERTYRVGSNRIAPHKFGKSSASLGTSLVSARPTVNAEPRRNSKT